MIQSFADTETERFWVTRRSRRIPSTIQATALRRLAQLSAAVVLGDLASPPGNRLEALKGNHRGQHSLRINDQWRLVFTWKSDGPHAVEIIDYH
ncbi:MAG: type II toxin-antitoxin system RelE/ParE family toxin [Planctomycetes bacterium]|nr:type II toxin-antitoxin system RelE/ParE family toxin [Planctomycetota bacterium]